MPEMKLFSFNAGSFALEPTVEEYLKSKRAIALDFGQSAYVNSDAMPSILSELVSSSSNKQNVDEALVAQLKAELAKFGAERQKLLDESARLASQLQSATGEGLALKAQVSAHARTIEILKSENARLQVAQKNAPAPAADSGLKQAYEKITKEFQSLKAQSIEAITSLKVLEDENEELREEIETLRSQLKSAPAQKAA
jgi:chromosome segregation ATPase